MRKPSLLERLADERGVAMITAIMVSVAAVTLSSVALSLAVHNVHQSSYDRNRTQAIDAAEGGLNQMVTFYRSATVAQVCSPPSNVANGTVSSGGSQIASYAVTVSCDSTTSPRQVLITSVGYAPNATAISHATRKMQTLVNVHPKGSPQSSTFGHAMFQSAATPALVLQNSLSGQSFNGADVYSNSDIVVSNQAIVSGNLTSQKGLSMQGNSQIQGSVWVNNDISMINSAFIGGNTTTHGGKISMSNSARINGNAWAAGTITPTSQVGGTSTPNSNPAPTSPPVETLPTFTFDATDPSWPQPVQTFTACASGLPSSFTAWFLANQSSLQGTARIAGTGTQANCAFGIPTNPAVLRLAGDFVLINDGDINISNQTSFFSADGLVHTLYLVSLNGNITVSNNTTFDPTIQVFMFSNKTVSLSNQSNINGLIYGNLLGVNNNFTLNFVPLNLPGFNPGSGGFDVDTVYIREVAS